MRIRCLRPGASSLDRAKKQRGQATVEYILILAFSVFIFISFFKGILAPAMGKAWSAVSAQVTQVFQGQNLHYYRTGLSQ